MTPLEYQIWAEQEHARSMLDAELKMAKYRRQSDAIALAVAFYGALTGNLILSMMAGALRDR